MHCHLTHEYYHDKLDKVIQRAKNAKLGAIVVSGVNPPTNREVLKLQEKYPEIIKVTLGLYPTDLIGIKPDESGLSISKKFNLKSELAFIEKNKDKIIGIGEIGLDYYWTKDPKDHLKQQENFRKIIQFAIRIKKPIIIHSRKAEKDVLQILDEEIKNKEINVIHHCFSGKKKLVQKAADLGHYLTVPAIVKKLKQFEYLAQIVPITQLLTETDAPWLSPYPDQKNEPKNITESIKKIAEIKETTESKAAKQIWENFQNILNNQ